MAKHKRGRGRIVALPTQTSITLSTLANNIVLKSAIITFGTRFYCTSAKGSWSIRDQTPGEGPVAVGYAHGDLSVTEVSEVLAATPSDPDDMIANERASRPIRRVGKFPSIAADEVLADGREMKTKIRFRNAIGIGHSLDIWCQNRSGAALTGGAIITWDGVLYGYWK